MTTYFIRTYDCVFPTGSINCTSLDNALNYSVMSSDVYLTDNFFYNLTGTSYANLFKFIYVPVKNAAPTEGSYVVMSDNTVGKSSSPYNESVWIANGWSTSNLTTFKTELCTKFESLKTQTSTKWGKDNSEINLIFMQVSFLGSSTKWFFQLFYKGNDPGCQETIVI